MKPLTIGVGSGFSRETSEAWGASVDVAGVIGCMVADDGPFDIVVLGAGVSGLAAAVFGALGGARVLVLERSAHVGGSAAASDGTIWVPNTRLAADAGLEDSFAAAEAYLDDAVAGHAPKALRYALLQAGPEAIHRLIDQTCLQFSLVRGRPDFLGGHAGAALDGRVIAADPFDAQTLGDQSARIRPAAQERLIWSGTGASPQASEFTEFADTGRSLRAFGRSAQLFGRYFTDRRRPSGPILLRGGQALAGRLLCAALDLGVTLRYNVQVSRLTLDPLEVHIPMPVRARQAIILATGGFNRDPERRAKWLPRAIVRETPVALSGTQIHDQVHALGARYRRVTGDVAYLAPCSYRRRAQGGSIAYAHFRSDGAKPGIIAVNQAGKRFANEAHGPHHLAWAQLETGALPAFLIADAAALRRYGLGLVPPGDRDLAPFINDGYLVAGASIKALARGLEIDAQGLAETVERFEAFAARGHDADFRRGAAAIERAAGDPRFGPNPTLGPLRAPPFYGVRITPGDVSAAMGFKTNPLGQVLDRRDQPMRGLYAIGDDMQSPLGGICVAPGQHLGQALTSAFLAARHAAARVGAADAQFGR
ncbi:MAG: FAD-binding protein [Pseudomonadota bacterium]